MANTEVVRASASELDGLAPLFSAYRLFFNPGADPAESRPFLEARLQDGDAVIFAARRGGELCGFAQLYPLWSSWYCRRIWFLSDLYVAPDCRALGVGAQLVERVKAHAIETQASSVMVELPQTEPHLYRFYDRLGFHRDAVFDLARFHPAQKTPKPSSS